MWLLCTENTFNSHFYTTSNLGTVAADFPYKSVPRLCPTISGAATEHYISVNSFDPFDFIAQILVARVE